MAFACLVSPHFLMQSCDTGASKPVYLALELCVKQAVELVEPFPHPLCLCP